ncbi:hypothetical protein HDU90_005453 [Geranomyces variabilis]|nr:hypothetical protein HDU90_005453 [Geranomyces variabilis]
MREGGLARLHEWLVAIGKVVKFLAFQTAEALAGVAPPNLLMENNSELWVFVPIATAVLESLRPNLAGLHRSVYRPEARIEGKISSSGNVRWSQREDRAYDEMMANVDRWPDGNDDAAEPRTESPSKQSREEISAETAAALAAILEAQEAEVAQEQEMGDAPPPTCGICGAPGTVRGTKRPVPFSFQWK